ncbi:ABC transporter permease [Oceanivirga salmonicida]|uniref:ABC transporter permease n=1 Tax=Oceanivirga salmonicida TaxID=1769291 RepID=UPI0008350655|nr:ABC transporter permease [Oceanivirga salmonicida]
MLKKKILRDFKEHFLQYFSIFISVVISMFLVVSVAGSADTVIKGVEKHAKDNVIEDGQFSVFVPLTDVQIDELRDMGIVLEKHFSLDFAMDEGSIRVFETRKKIDLIELDKGKEASSETEIVLEKNYCKANNIAVGDEITIADNIFTVVGIGSTPDYDDVLDELTDSSSNAKIFSTAFVNEEGYKLLLNSKKSLKAESVQYAYKLYDEATSDDVYDKISEFEFKVSNVKDEYAYEYFNKLTGGYKQATYKNLKEFIEAEDNPRIDASARDIQVDKKGALTAGFIILILLAYVLSTFVISAIDRESKIIGTLYALGFSKKELIKHFIALPVAICVLGGITGTILGFLAIDLQMGDNVNYFSYPKLNHIYPTYLIIYGVVSPILISLLINFVFINKKLSKEPLDLMRKTQSAYKPKDIKGNKYRGFKFINKFRIKLFIREIKYNLTISLGIFISLLLIMLAFSIYSALTNLVDETSRDVKFNYMYSLSYPDNEKDNYEGVEKAYLKKLDKKVLNENFNVSILGIYKNSDSFPYEIETNKDELYISTSVANKYAVEVGDDFELEDKINSIKYVFKVKKIVNYAPGLFVFMNIDDMRKRFDKEHNYYNLIISDNKLDIEKGRLYSVTTGNDVKESSHTFMELMNRLIYILIFSSVILFVLVMYLMVKMIIDRQKYNISMFKLFGFNKTEISKIYLRNNLYTVIISALIFIPITRYIILMIYPFLVSNRAVGFNLKFALETYFVIAAIILISYFISFALAKLKLNRISVEEILKDRE